MKEEKNISEIKFSKWLFATISLLPILLWPLFFYGSIFIFDDPNANQTNQYLAFYGINAYPIYLIVNTLIANKLYKKNNKFCIVLYLWPITLFGLILLYIFST